MQKLLLVSHSTFAQGVKGAVEMIIGKLQEINVICLEEGESSEQYTKKVQQLLQTDDYKMAEKIVVLADLRGGSPHTNCLKALEEARMLDKTVVITGLNLALAIEIAMLADFKDDEKIKLAVDAAKANLGIFIVEKSVEEEL
ncbi:MAG: PTS sugar transporter subunit IIA [Culicoidibacterales bacterium]